MNLSRKCQYALRALYELASRRDQGPVISRQIASAQGLPVNFLELILKELRQAGWVDSLRGPNGGYVLAVNPAELSVGEVIRFIDGPFAPVKCMAGRTSQRHCAAKDRCAFAGLWDRAESLLAGLYDNTSFQEVVEDQRVAVACCATEYQI